MYSEKNYSVLCLCPASHHSCVIVPSYNRTAIGPFDQSFTPVAPNPRTAAALIGSQWCEYSVWVSEETCSLDWMTVQPSRRFYEPIVPLPSAVYSA